LKKVWECAKKKEHDGKQIAKSNKPLSAGQKQSDLQKQQLKQLKPSPSYKPPSSTSVVLFYQKINQSTPLLFTKLLRNFFRFTGAKK